MDRDDVTILVVQRWGERDSTLTIASFKFPFFATVEGKLQQTLQADMDHTWCSIDFLEPLVVTRSGGFVVSATDISKDFTTFHACNLGSAFEEDSFLYDEALAYDARVESLCSVDGYNCALGVWYRDDTSIRRNAELTIIAFDL